MDGTTVIIYLACIIVLLMIGKIFYIPLKHILKLLLNSVLGGFIIYIVNIIGSTYNFHIGLNYVTAIFTGILGIPRCYCFNYYEIIIIKEFLRGFSKTLMEKFIQLLQISLNYEVYLHLNLYF